MTKREAKVKMKSAIRDYLIAVLKGDNISAELNKGMIFLYGERLKEPIEHD